MPNPEQTLADLVKRFSPEAAEGLEVIYQLHLTGDAGGVWHLAVRDQQCRLSSGPAAAPDVTITMTVDDWDELWAGRLDVYQAFLQGRLQVAGDISLAGRLQSLFGL